MMLTSMLMGYVVNAGLIGYVPGERLQEAMNEGYKHSDNTLTYDHRPTRILSIKQPAADATPPQTPTASQTSRVGARTAGARTRTLATIDEEPAAASSSIAPPPGLDGATAAAISSRCGDGVSTCPLGKPLKMRVVEERYECSLCGDHRIPAGTVMFSCVDKECEHNEDGEDYDLCRGCFQNARRVHVSGLPKDTQQPAATQGALRTMLSASGIRTRSDNISILTDTRNQARRGFAFITARDADEAFRICAALNDQTPAAGDAAVLGQGPLKASPARAAVAKQ